MKPEDFNPRGSCVYKKDLVKFLKEIDSSIHLRSSISKEGLIQLVEQRLGKASVPPATSQILQQRSNSPVLEIIPDTVLTSPSVASVASIPAVDPQPGGSPFIELSESPSIKQVKQTTRNDTTAASRPIFIDPPCTGSRKVSFIVYPSSVSPDDNYVRTAITRMNVGRQWCYLEPIDPNVKPTISRLQVGREWCYIQQGQAGIISKAKIPTTPKSAVELGSIYYWDPKDDTRHSILTECSQIDPLFESGEKIDQWSMIDASDAVSERGSLPSSIINNNTPNNIVELPHEPIVPGAFPTQLDSLIYPPSHSFTGMLNF
ncbi:hypothetical protein H4Q26_000735 [Puccinia striiformis f. sp. tritici PST-130]|uniref:Uncharacterized protein n=1 Tax=Puccinia striiformis f. sp. tritici PST-78 TaxID=1165861 RepID=A0A0L0VY85_9BASI|nr:hypothetical protein H4Q26_000735 [Puccinia striiformis f. sp. tritici PST-130]KNE89185.1 hypothetical protein PSTG_17355 [Puccinia striiformis f. sp. tritici PST-78]KNF04274.1 hypothetical protein PSTG_02618 [Puccinia striiformis f. sp. tritici PST-78]